MTVVSFSKNGAKIITYTYLLTTITNQNKVDEGRRVHWNWGMLAASQLRVLPIFRERIKT